MAINHIYNPSFEVDLANTAVEDNLTNGNPTITRTSAEANNGTYSCAFYIPGTVETDSWRAKLRINSTNNVAVVSGTRYVVSLYAKASVAHNTFSAEFTGAGSYYPGNKSLTTAWARYDWEFTASATGNLELRFLGNNGNEVTIYVDGIMCEALVSGGPSTYFDGSTVGYDWEGTAHNSRSGDEFTTYSISGNVTLNATAVSGAVVRLVDQAGSYVGSDTTDVNGFYEFTLLDNAKSYHVIVEYTNGGTKYNAKSKWDITPAEDV